MEAALPEPYSANSARSPVVVCSAFAQDYDQQRELDDFHIQYA